jgi:hypothetical protein
MPGKSGVGAELRQECDVAVEPHEGADRRSVGQAHHVGGDEAECFHVPARAVVEVRRLDDEVAQFSDLGRLERRALRIVDPDDLARRIVQDREPGREWVGRREAVPHVDLDALWVAKTHDRAPAWAVRVNRTSKGFLTMWLAAAAAGLNRLNAEGKKVLVHGAAGGLGRLALQSLSAWGARLTPIAKASDISAYLEAGAAEVVDRNQFANLE